MENVVYLKADKCVVSDSKKVKIGLFAEVICKDKKLQREIKNTEVFNFEECKMIKKVMSIMDVIEIIQNTFQNIVVINVGESEFIIEYNVNKNQNRLLESFKVIVICIIVFFGAAFGIMSFHEDTGILGLFEDVSNYFLDGEKSNVIEVSYSIGLALGIVIFYDRPGINKRGNVLSPLEIEMKMYEDTINETMLMSESRSDE